MRGKSMSASGTQLKRQYDWFLSLNILVWWNMKTTFKADIFQIQFSSRKLKYCTRCDWIWKTIKIWRKEGLSCQMGSFLTSSTVAQSAVASPWVFSTSRHTHTHACIQIYHISRMLSHVTLSWKLTMLVVFALVVKITPGNWMVWCTVLKRAPVAFISGDLVKIP